MRVAGLRLFRYQQCEIWSVVLPVARLRLAPLDDGLIVNAGEGSKEVTAAAACFAIEKET